MKLAFMSFSTPEATFLEMLDIARAYGYDGVELRIDAGHAHGIEPSCGADVLSDARETARERGVDIACVATSCAFSGIRDLGESLDAARRAIRLAQAVGAPVLRVFGGVLPEGDSREVCFGRVVRALETLAPFAAAHGVRLLMETHDHWCHPDQVADIMRAVNHPAIGVNWDFMHPLFHEGFSVEESFARLRDWIGHVHVHDGVRPDGQLILKSVGEGAVDHKKALALLAQAHYEGYISGEWIGWEPYEKHLPREAERLRALMPGQDAHGQRPPR